MDMLEDSVELIQIVIADHDAAALGAMLDRNRRTQQVAEAVFQRDDIRILGLAPLRPGATAPAS
jgi:hypothetical protein